MAFCISWSTKQGNPGRIDVTQADWIMSLDFRFFPVRVFKVSAGLPAIHEYKNHRNIYICLHLIVMGNFQGGRWEGVGEANLLEIVALPLENRTTLKGMNLLP